MEAVANSVDDALIDSLSFKLSNSASYITDRKSVTFWPTGSNIYKTNSGTKVIRFVLTNDNWLDPSTLRLMFNLVNNDATSTKMLRTISGGWSFFRRIRIMSKMSLYTAPVISFPGLFTLFFLPGVLFLLRVGFRLPLLFSKYLLNAKSCLSKNFIKFSLNFIWKK